MRMYPIIQYILRAIAFLFGLFDLLGFMWESGLAETSLELVWWSSPAVSLILGSAIPDSIRKNYIVAIFVMGITLVGFSYAGQQLYGSWLNPGIDSTNNMLRVLFILFIIFRFGSIFGSHNGNSQSRS